MFERVILILFSTIFSGIDFSQCIILLIIHEMQTAADENPNVDVRVTFLDISKVFDKVNYDGITFNLKAYGFEGELILLLKNLKIIF